MSEPDFEPTPNPFAKDCSATELDRRLFPRYDSRSRARLFRSDDRMRFGVIAEIWDISVEGMGIVLSSELRPGESLGLTLINSVQRFSCDLRGTVLWIQPTEDGQFRAGVRFMRRLAPLDVSALRGRPRDNHNSPTTWL